MGDKLTREELKKFLPSHRAIVAWEQGVDDTTQASAAAAAAQTTADTATTAAAAAQGTADAAASAAAGLALPDYLVLTLSGALSNERRLVPGFGLSLTDGGANADATIALSDIVALLGSDVADSTAAFVNATGLAAALVANATYLVDALLTFQAAATTTGIALGFTLPAAAEISGTYRHNITTTASEGSYNIASGAVKGNTTGVLVANENVPITGRWLIKTGANAGSAQLQFRSEVAASAVTLKAGLSMLSFRRIA